MSKEIKEILDKLKDSNWYDELDLTGTRWIELTWKETHLLLDYITNLQQKVEQLEKENKILKENALHNDKVVDKVNWENMLLKRKNKEIDRLINLNKQLVEECQRLDDEEIRLNNKINKDLDKFNDELNTFKWLENDFKEHSIHYYQLECLVEYLKQLKEEK